MMRWILLALALLVGASGVAKAQVQPSQGVGWTGAFTALDCVVISANWVLKDAGAPCVTTSLPFSGLTSGTNTTAAMVVGSGASLAFTGTLKARSRRSPRY